MISPTRSVADDGHHRRVLLVIASPMMGMGTANNGAADNCVAKNGVADANDKAAKNERRQQWALPITGALYNKCCIG